MFASAKTNAAAAVVLLALVILPAPLLPPLGLTGKLQSVLGVSWKTAYLVIEIEARLDRCAALSHSQSLPQP